MAPKKGSKRAIEDEIFSSKPTLKQKKFQPRLKAIKAMETPERPRKRVKNQTTMTQLDFGKRSYLEAICDSDDEDEDVKSEDEEMTSTASKRGGGRRSRLPEKTDSQDTLTQFVKRAGDVRVMFISDSEDEGEEDVSDVEAETGEEEVAAENDAAFEDGAALEVGQDRVRQEHQGPSSSSIAIAVSSRALPPHAQPRTPKRVRVLPVPSSRSPPDTALSTQVTPRQARSPERRSPLKERSASIRGVSAMRSPLKEKSANVRVVPPASSPLKTAPSLPSSKRSAQKKRKSPAQKPAKEPPTKRRVRDFNARFAILEQENADSRGKRLRPMTRAAVSAPPMRAMAHANMETQYSMTGAETQEAWLELPFGDAPAKNIESDIRREESPEVVENSQTVEQVSGGEEATKVRESVRIVDDTEDEDESDVESHEVTAEDILIPSSQSKNNGVSARQQASQVPASSPVVPENSDNLLEESLPESTYNSPASRSTLRSRDTQELASDQLLRETQQASMFRFPSSPEIMPAPNSTSRRLRSSQTKTQDHWHVRPSQATTVDESMSHSSHRTQRHLKTLELSSTPRAPPFSSSSPATEPLLDKALIISSSPLLNDPILSSSSPRVQEPKTPSVLRNLRRPLRMDELVSESLDASLPLPPGWSARTLDLGVDSEDDDGEL